MTQLAMALDGVRFERGGSLAQRAHRLLQAGPASTADVAAEVLGIVHGGGVAAAAVFELLGGDPRFSVSREGVWSLTVRESAAKRGARKGITLDAVDLRALRTEEWVVVDLETTGGSPFRGHRVTEVAAVTVSGGKITETYSSLVNPERFIPGMITSLTGISNDMVAAAPRFAEVAPRVREAIAGRVFVAHNAAFDWRFLCHEMETTTGSRPAGRQLCTVRLARKLLPELPSRGLDALALYFGLEIENRHRALDDAVATAHLLLRFIDMLEERGAADWHGMQQVLRARAKRKKRTATPRSMESA